ncbi:MAG: hypothetical protein EVB11_13130 [Winogradskyella sp.]|nr:MAG: hypothetical protein EVB11_13130 [Winogradskyella sp.]
MSKKKSDYTSYDEAQEKLEELVRAFKKYYDGHINSELPKKKTKGANNAFYRQLEEDSKKLSDSKHKIISGSWLRKYFDEKNESQRNFQPSSIVDLESLIKIYNGSSKPKDYNKASNYKQIIYLIIIMLLVITGFIYGINKNNTIEEISTFGFKKDPRNKGLGNVYITTYDGNIFFDTINLSRRKPFESSEFKVRMEFRNQSIYNLKNVIGKIKYPKRGTSNECQIIGTIMPKSEYNLRLTDTAYITNLPDKWSLKIERLIQVNDNLGCGEIFFGKYNRRIEELESKKGLNIGSLSYNDRMPEGNRRCSDGYLIMVFKVKDESN